MMFLFLHSLFPLEWVCMLISWLPPLVVWVWVQLFLFYTFLFEIAHIKKLWAHSWRMNLICLRVVVWGCRRAMLFSWWYTKLCVNYRFFHNFIWMVLSAWINCVNVFKWKEKHWQTLSQNTVSMFQYKYRLSSLIWLQLTME